jgi:hypothetical protein
MQSKPSRARSDHHPTAHHSPTSEHPLLATSHESHQAGRIEEVPTGRRRKGVLRRRTREGLSNVWTWPMAPCTTPEDYLGRKGRVSSELANAHTVSRTSTLYQAQQSLPSSINLPLWLLRLSSPLHPPRGTFTESSIVGTVWVAGWHVVKHKLHARCTCADFIPSLAAMNARPLILGLPSNRFHNFQRSYRTKNRPLLFPLRECSCKLHSAPWHTHEVRLHGDKQTPLPRSQVYG